MILLILALAVIVFVNYNAFGMLFNMTKKKNPNRYYAYVVFVIMLIAEWFLLDEILIMI